MDQECCGATDRYDFGSTNTVNAVHEVEQIEKPHQINSGKSATKEPETDVGSKNRKCWKSTECAHRNYGGHKVQSQSESGMREQLAVI